MEAVIHCNGEIFKCLDSCLLCSITRQVQGNIFCLFLNALKKVKDLNIPSNIESMGMNFELGAMKSATAAWKIVLKGCYFHFTQSIWTYRPITWPIIICQISCEMYPLSPTCSCRRSPRNYQFA